MRTLVFRCSEPLDSATPPLGLLGANSPGSALAHVPQDAHAAWLGSSDANTIGLTAGLVTPGAFSRAIESRGTGCDAQGAGDTPVEALDARLSGVLEALATSQAAHEAATRQLEVVEERARRAEAEAAEAEAHVQSAEARALEAQEGLVSPSQKEAALTHVMEQVSHSPSRITTRRSRCPALVRQPFLPSFTTCRCRTATLSSLTAVNLM